MLQIGVVIKMSGLLLLTPSTSEGQLPYYALLPKENHHEARLGYREPTGLCPAGTEKDGEICYFRIEGYDITIGTYTPAGPIELNGAVANVSRAAGMPVRTSLLGNHPPTDTLQARVRLNAGEQTDQCYLARWFFNGNPWAPLGNVITWTFTHSEPGNLKLTFRKLDNLGGPTRTVEVPHPARGDVELFILHALPPPEDTRTSFLMEARHFDHYYNMLGVAPTGRRPLPVLLRRDPLRSGCPWAPGSRSPGAPTCLVAGGAPAP
jgi:hypothetical protein